MQLFTNYIKLIMETEKLSINLSPIIFYSVGFTHVSVCALKSVPIEVITEKLNDEHPTGIESNWELSKDKKFADGSDNPCACNTHPAERIHYLFNC